MVSMSPRKAAPTHISIPARILSLTRARSRGGSVDSSDSISNPCTPSPRTPLPYSCEYISGALRLDSPLMTPTEAPPSLFATAQLDGVNPAKVASSGKNKRGREDEEVEKVEAWSAEDIELVRATVLHPFRPLSSPYPPGELAPPHILDEITTQIVNCSSDQRLLSSKARRALNKSRAISSASASPNSSASSSSSAATAVPITRSSSGSSASSGTAHDSPTLSPASQSQAQNSRWPHSWESTRKRVYLASVEVTREAHGLIVDKQIKGRSREERDKARPGLRRVDSMDFLNQVEDEDEDGQGQGLRVPAGSNGQVGRAMRLSTTLQNSTKFSPSPMLLRSASMGSGLDTLSASSSSSSSGSPAPVRPAGPVRASTGSIGPILTVTPASPQKAKPSKPAPANEVGVVSKLHTTSAPLAKVPSIRKNRAQRPSLLQRGRSFTASDLGSINGDASEEEQERVQAGGEGGMQCDDVEGEGKQGDPQRRTTRSQGKGKGKSLSSPNTPWLGSIPLGMGMTSMTSLAALSTSDPTVPARRPAVKANAGVNAKVEYDTSPMSMASSTIPDQPFALGDGIMCDSPTLLPDAASSTNASAETTVPAGGGAGADKPVPIGLGLPASVSAPLLHYPTGADGDVPGMGKSASMNRLQTHLVSPPSPRTRRRSQALGNELLISSAPQSGLSASGCSNGGLAAGAMIETRPSKGKGSAAGGWSDTDDDAEIGMGADSVRGRRAMKRQRSNVEVAPGHTRGHGMDVNMNMGMGKGAGIGRSGSMAFLKQTSAGGELGRAMGTGGMAGPGIGSSGGGSASPFDEKTGFLL